jgi:putative nucleotidyltransferase with HDIG domain
MNFGSALLRRRTVPGGVKKLVKSFQALEETGASPAPAPGDPGITAGTDLDDTELGPLAKLPPFRPVVIGLLRMLDREDAPIGDIARLVESDAALVGQLLALVNSPLFGVRGTVASAAHGVSLLGIERTRSLVATLAMRALMVGAPRTPVVRRFWMHSTACAAIARELAPCFGIQKDQAHIAAMMHDLGRMGLLAGHTEEYTVLALSAWETVDQILDAEREQFGMDHCQAGAKLAEAWGLPKILQRVAAHHHAKPALRDALSLVQLSCRLADDYMFQAILQRGSHKPAQTIEWYAPADLQERLIAKTGELQTQAIESIQALDF